jgi:uncharacterized protein YjdB
LALLRNVLLVGLVMAAGCTVKDLVGLLAGLVVVVSPVAPSLTVGQAVQLTVTVKDVSGNPVSGPTVTWASGAPAVATVSGTGLVTGMGVGTAAITATSQSQSGTATATVTAAPVAAVAVSPASATLTVGQTVQLVGTPKDASGNPLSGRVVTWASGAPAVATVNGSGLASGVAAGTATITATSEGQSGTAAVTVTTVPVAAVVVSPASAALTVGQTVQLTATPKDASGNPLSGRVVTWASGAPAVATVNGSGLVSGVAAGTATITATSEGQSATATITVTASATPPGTVTDLAVASVTVSSATLTFTEVNDGTGQPASYYMRYAVGTISWGLATEVGPIAGTAIGAKRSYTVTGLVASTSYQFQIVAFRGTPNVNAVFGGLSNVASGTTAASAAPVASVTVSPPLASVSVALTQQFTATLKDASGNILTGRTVTWASSTPTVATLGASGLATALLVGTTTITATSEGQSGSTTLTVTAATPPPASAVLLQSDWAQALATRDFTDGGRWTKFDGSSGTMSVVAAGPNAAYPNAIQFIQQGTAGWAYIQKTGFAPPSTDYYLRFYFREDDTSPAQDHAVVTDAYTWQDLMYIRKTGNDQATTGRTGSGWSYCILFYDPITYPVGNWRSPQLQHGVWYRLEYWVHFTDASHVQIHPRIYDLAGNLLADETVFQQVDFGMATWGGSSTWTLGSWQAAGNASAVNPALLTTFAIDNNGQLGAVATGQAWYVAGVMIRNDRWAGP